MKNIRNTEQCVQPRTDIFILSLDRTAGGRERSNSGVREYSYINKKWLDFLGLKVPETTEELEKVLIAFRDHAEELKSEFDIEEM